ncbi:MAG: DUF2478 domain-containing protein [Beijerinckiaceae bacterium]
MASGARTGAAVGCDTFQCRNWRSHPAERGLPRAAQADGRRRLRARARAARSGLYDAFRAAFAAGIPVATAVSPSVGADWLAFAGEFVEFLDVNAGLIDDWWERLKKGSFAVAAE